MTAHWGVPDPAAVEGTELEKMNAFRETFRTLENRIRIFTSLPLASIERMQAQGAPGRDRQIDREPRIAMLRRLFAEGLGSLLLAATVIGSGIMAEQLAGGNSAVALLANTAATVAVLAVLIALLAPISGAHFNPAVSFVMALRQALPWREAGAYAVVQVLGCCVGAILAHAMFATAPAADLTACPNGHRAMAGRGRGHDRD